MCLTGKVAGSPAWPREVASHPASFWSFPVSPHSATPPWRKLRGRSGTSSTTTRTGLRIGGLPSHSWSIPCSSPTPAARSGIPHMSPGLIPFSLPTSEQRRSWLRSAAVLFLPSADLCRSVFCKRELCFPFSTAQPVTPQPSHFS